MDGMALIADCVRRAAARRRAFRALDAASRTLMVSAIAMFMAMIVYKLAPIPGIWLTALGGAALAAPAFAALWVAFHPVRPIEAARWLDHTAGLRERLATALELGNGSVAQAPWKELVIRDASAAVASLDLKRLLPWRFPKTSRYGGLAIILIALLALAPEYRTAAQKAAVRDKAVVKDVGKNLGLAIRRELQKRPEAPESVQKRMDEIVNLADRLAGAKLTRAEAVTELAKAADGLKEQTAALERSPALQRLQEAAKNSSGAQSPAALQQKAEALSKAMGDKAAQDPQAVEKLQKDLEKLRESAKAMAHTGNATPEAKAEMQRQLANMAQRAAELGHSMDSLQQASQALESAQVDRFLKNLDAATQDLGQLGQAAQQLAQVKEQMEQMGRDLAEQLHNGQAEAAIKSIQKMMDKLSQSGLSAADRDQIAKDLAKSLSPAKSYGKTAEHLQKALSQAQNGQNGEAQQSLAAAQRELQQTLDELGNSQSLMASMSALEKAQASVGSSQMWGSRAGEGPPRSGSGGKGGRGVGTWSDNDAWAIPDHIDSKWDNSGLTRPDQGAKGQTARDASTPNNLVPTKVNGQFQPGGPMPSVTLKGVSIKGSSGVQYTEAVTTAQDDARAALSQDKIPKAYRNAVRDYFDDTHK